MEGGEGRSGQGEVGLGSPPTFFSLLILGGFGSLKE